MQTETAADPRFARVLAKDKSADGAFVYAVVTTGVYCRPSCAARPPKPQNVRIYATGDEAARAGFRPCKRCRPDEPPAAERHAAAIARACEALREVEDKPDYDALARDAGLSRHHFHRLFKEITGLTPGAYLRAHRQAAAVEALRGGARVTEAIYGAGYSSASRFYEGAKLGVKPSAYARKGAGERIRFAVGQCSIGAILVAATEKGVCAIQFGDDPEALVAGLQAQFPKAELIGADAAFEALVARVVGLVERPGQPVALPLDVRGTALQQQVWRALADIPAGKTLTYAQLAERIGRPKAVRAVASACAGNRIAVAIPCHRVVRTGGGLAGYRWGVERKAALLAREAKA
jgi:AraC family transcriptional regulator of adaptative response/methylated-DNA-[protein]-cysteine methyltransferase